jgi:hypothetical protein
MERVTMSRLGVVVAVLVGCMCLVGTTAAWAGQTVKISAAFTPDKLGSPTNASGEGQFVSTIPGEIPSPITGFTIKGPAGLKIDLHGTTTCTEAILLGPAGPEGCPVNSVAGSGGGLGALKLGAQIIEQPFTLNFFLGDNSPNHTVILLYVDATSPVSIQLVFTAVVEKEPPPYGLGFHFNIPLIPTLPGASDASVLNAHVTIGASNAYFYEKVHGKRKRVHVKGLVLPKTCPKGGFPVQSDFTFEDGSQSENSIKVPCPAGKKK